jgi:cell division protein ZapA
VKQVEVQILGQVYMLGCPEGGESLLSNAVAAVDREMTVIRDAGKVKARERIAVLAALNLAYQLAEQGAAASTAAPTAANGGQPAGEEAHSDIDALVRRLDAALGEDGHLL